MNKDEFLAMADVCFEDFYNNHTKNATLHSLMGNDQDRVNKDLLFSMVNLNSLIDALDVMELWRLRHSNDQSFSDVYDELIDAAKQMSDEFYPTVIKYVQLGYRVAYINDPPATKREAEKKWKEFVAMPPGLEQHLLNHYSVVENIKENLVMGFMAIEHVMKVHGHKETTWESVLSAFSFGCTALCIQWYAAGQSLAIVVRMNEQLEG